MEPQVCRSHWTWQTADKCYSFYPDPLAQILIFVSLDHVSPLRRHAASEEKLGKWTVVLIPVQASMGSFGTPYTSEDIFNRWYLKLCFQCKWIRFFFLLSLFHKSWSTVSKLKNIQLGWKPLLFLSSLRQYYVFHPSQGLSVVPTLLPPSEGFS